MHGLIAPVAHPGARLDNIPDAVRANTPPTAHAPYTATAAPEWSQHLNVVRRESNDNFAQLASVPAPRLTARFMQPFESSPPAPVPGIQMPPPFDAAVHASIDDYVAAHRTQAREAFTGLLAELQAFANERFASAEHASHRRATSQVVKDLGEQLSGTRAGIAQLPDRVLLTTTLADLHQIVATLADPTLPIEGAQQILEELYGRTGVCGGGVNNAVNSAAIKAEALRNGLPGLVNTFKLQVAHEVSRTSNAALASDTHWDNACLRALRQEFGLPAVAADATVTHHLTSEENDTLHRAMREACTARAFIGQLTEQVHDHLRGRIDEGRGKDAGASAKPAALDLDALAGLLDTLRGEVQARFGIDLGPSTLCNALFRDIGVNGDDSLFEPHGNSTLLRVAIRDELQKAGLIESTTLRVAQGAQGALVFDGDVFCIETSYGRRYPTVEDLQNFRPAPFGPTASRLASDVISTCDPSRIRTIHRDWLFLDQATLHGCIKHAPTASLQQLMTDETLREIFRDLSPDEHGSTLVALLEKGAVTCRQLVNSRVIDLHKDVSDTLCLLIHRGLADHAMELLALGAKRSWLRTRIDDWRRNPASLALYHANSALYAAVKKAGWSHADISADNGDFVKEAIKRRRVDAVKLMIEQGVVWPDHPGLPILMIQDKAVDMLRLVDQKALARRVLEAEPSSPLRYAVEAGSREAVVYLCSLAVNLPQGVKQLQRALDAPFCREPGTYAGITPLRLAVIKGDLETARALVACGARVRPQDVPAMIRGASDEMAAFIQEFASTQRTVR